MIIHCKNVNSFVKIFAYNARLNVFKKPNKIMYLSINELNTSTENGTGEKKTLTVGSHADKQISEHVKISERVKQTTKDITHISVIVIGIGISCFVFYAVFKEFFSSKSPSSVFAHALKKCKEDPRLSELLGEPIKGHGEMTSRRRARHVSFVEYENNGKIYIRIKFYLKGSKSTATVHCETAKDSPRSHFRYLFAEMDSYPHQVIVVEDNRLLEQTAN